MLQRIQSVYLAISLLIGIVFAFLAIAEFDANDSIYLIKATGIFYEDASGVFFESPNESLSVVLIFHLLLTGSSIFQYKNRKMQMKLCALNILLLFTLTALIFFVDFSVPESIKQGTTPAINYLFGSLLPIVSVVFQFMAMRSIQKDEKLIKSTERIR
ncbi:MAG: DUF4293 domain-containing protein [Flavobacteriales bacterium]|nr:DUF4293 domain-containing protein [Flavobacteriales bacterium]